MKSRTLFATALILLTPLVVLAFHAQADQVRKNDLKSKPFIRGPLKITLTRFNSFDGIRVEVENMSDDFTIFDPRRLSFIDKDDNQVDILGAQTPITFGTSVKDFVVTAEVTRIAPKTRIKRSYSLTNYMELPARLYYEDKLLATIIN
jgi:hypothetical protein